MRLTRLTLFDIYWVRTDVKNKKMTFSFREPSNGRQGSVLIGPVLIPTLPDLKIIVIKRWTNLNASLKSIFNRNDSDNFSSLPLLIFENRPLGIKFFFWKFLRTKLVVQMTSTLITNTFVAYLEIGIVTRFISTPFGFRRAIRQCAS